MAEALVAKCPACDGLIDLPNASVGLQVECPDCEELLIISSLKPSALSYALDMEEEASFANEDARRQER